MTRLGSEIYLRRQSLREIYLPERSVREPAAWVKMSVICRDMSETCHDNMSGTTCNHKSASTLTRFRSMGMVAMELEGDEGEDYGGHGGPPAAFTICLTHLRKKEWVRFIN